MLFPEELLHVVWIDTDSVDEELVSIVDAAEEGTSQGQDEKQKDNAATDPAPNSGSSGLAAHLVKGPLDDHDDARSDKQDGPPVSVPYGKGGEGEATAADQ